MEFPTQAVRDVLLCCEAIKRKRKLAAENQDINGKFKQEKFSNYLNDSNEDLRKQYIAVLTRQDGGNEFSSHTARIKKLRQMIILQGLPNDDSEPFCDINNSQIGGDGEREYCTLRGIIWKVLLGAYHLDASIYMDLVSKGASPMDPYIQQDTFRIFKGNEAFKQRAPKEKISRVNNAFVHLHFSDKNSFNYMSQSENSSDDMEYGTPIASGNSPVIDFMKEENGRITGMNQPSNERRKEGIYVQVMTVLCAPFLFIMPEVDAFFCFNELLTQHIPRYIMPNLDGVHVGCALMAKVLQIVDPELYQHLSCDKGYLKIYAMPILMSLHASTRPLEELLKLWDVLFAFGVHMEVLLGTAQVIMIRHKLLRHNNPYTLLMRNYVPELDSEILVSAALCLIPHIPQHLLDEIARHSLVSPESYFGSREEAFSARAILKNSGTK